jgi:hypothetical protein
VQCKHADWVSVVEDKYGHRYLACSEEHNLKLQSERTWSLSKHKVYSCIGTGSFSSLTVCSMLSPTKFQQVSFSFLETDAAESIMDATKAVTENDERDSGRRKATLPTVVVGVTSVSEKLYMSKVSQNT